MTGDAAGALRGLESHLVRSVPEVARDLESFVALLRKWQPAQNLVSRETLDSVWHRHIRDSLQILPKITGSCTRIVDLGSGGGFPGLPLAIALKTGPQRFHLIDSNRRKVAFLNAVSRDLHLEAKAVAARIESVAGISSPDLITCRATARLVTLLEWMAPIWGPQTRAVLHKGAEHGEELAECAAAWEFDVLVSPSLTDSSGVILEISGLRHK